MASPDEIDRHRRHILLKEIGGPGVARLKAARVSIIGAGALGGPVALYLAAAGVGSIEILDDDTVERSNLQRQVQYSDAQIGAPKAETLTARLKALNPGVDAKARAERFGEGTELSGEILIDASDNFATRHSLARLAHESGRMLVSGAAIGWQGQVAVFASGLQAGEPCYGCFVPEAPDEGEDCATVGVAGPVTGIVGSRMALEVIKIVTGAGTPLISRLWRLDGLSGESRIARIRQDPDCPICGR